MAIEEAKFDLNPVYRTFTPQYSTIDLRSLSDIDNVLLFFLTLFITVPLLFGTSIIFVVEASKLLIQEELSLRSLNSYFSVGLYLGAFLALWGGVHSVRIVYRYPQAVSIAKRLHEKGIFLDGEITSIYGRHMRYGVYVVILEYQFEAPNGSLLKGTTEARRDDLKNVELPPKGTPVTILYADDQAHMAL